MKLDVDRHSEDRIVAVLAAGSPFAILTEERGLVQSRRPQDTMRWIVDPLDGSMNLLRDIPLSAVSIGLWDGDEPLLGAVYDFNRDEMFSGIVGRGAWLNGNAVRVRPTSSLDRAVICIGFPAGSDFAEEPLLRIVRQVQRYKKVRLLGSAALSLAYVAAGRADAYYERNIKLWDVAAGVALVHAAGGAVSRWPSPSPETLTVYAHNGLLPDLEDL